MERYIIWDIDGTVVDTRKAISSAYLHALSVLGIEEQDGTRIYQYVGKRSSLIFSECHNLAGEALQKARDAYYGFFETTGLAMCDLYPGIQELLCELQQNGAVMTVASARGQGQLDMMLDKLGIASYFSLVLGTELNHLAADKPKLVRECIDFMGAAPQQCVMVGDRIYDIQGGQLSGTRSIGVTYGFGTREELNQCAPDAIAEDVASLRALLLGVE